MAAPVVLIVIGLHLIIELLTRPKLKKLMRITLCNTGLEVMGIVADI
jgi:hypothetical protein